jgi:hypothetical protein
MATARKTWDSLLSRLTALTLAGAAAALSSTLFKAALVPQQLLWIGPAGTLLCMCLIPVCFLESQVLGHWRRLFGILLLVSFVILVYLRASYVVSNTVNGVTQMYLVGYPLTSEGRQNLCNSHTTDEELIQCAGVDLIPYLYGKSYRLLEDLYLADYLLLVSFFIA